MVRKRLEPYVDAPLYDKNKALIKRYVGKILANVVRNTARNENSRRQHPPDLPYITTSGPFFCE